MVDCVSFPTAAAIRCVILSTRSELQFPRAAPGNPSIAQTGNRGRQAFRDARMTKALYPVQEPQS